MSLLETAQACQLLLSPSPPEVPSAVEGDFLSCLWSSVALAQEESWGYVSRGVTADGSITFTCYEDKPQVDIPLQIEVNR